MRKRSSHITVFEHESLRTDRGEHRLTQEHLEALQLYYGENGVPYYSLIHNGVRFNEYVGVIQVGSFVVEVLPKADKSNETERWRNVLISMLHSVGIFDIHAPSNSELRLRSNSILDLYFEMFIKEIEYLIRRGLVKKYHETEGNISSLKGSIQFARQISQNLVHQERFYVKYSKYDTEHHIHAIIYKTLKLLSHINTNVQLSGRIGSILLDFPVQHDIKISEAIFEKINLDRKTEPYRNSIEIAKLILLNYYPDVVRGSNNVLALMFDMNFLWERFVYESLRKYKAQSSTIRSQSTKYFWKPIRGYRSKIRPDIIINKGKNDCVVLDTKWKNISGYNPSPEDLRQMFVYMKYYGAKKVALIYPGPENLNRSGLYYDHNTPDSIELSNEECSVISLGVQREIKTWQKDICDYVNEWIAG